MPYAHPTLRRPVLFLALAVLAGFQARAAVSQAKMPEPVAAVLLFDGKLPDQVTLDAEVRKAVEPHAGKVNLRTMHAGRAETVPFLRLHDLTRKNAPLLLIMSSGNPKARILKRYPLVAGGELKKNLRTLLAALKLPAPRPDPVPPGPIVAFATDGGADEKKHLLMSPGAQQVKDGVRLLDRGSALVYRLPLPEGLLSVDLRAELGGHYLVEWAGDPVGPWTNLMDSYRYFGVAAERLKERTRPVASVSHVLAAVADTLYLRIRPNGRGRDRLELARLELIAMPAGALSGENAWLAEAAKIRKEAGGVPETENVSLLAGTLPGRTVLSAERSPYLMSGDVLVPAASTLVIEPGVTIRAAGRVIIRVQGDLIARGTADKPIVFTAAEPRQPDAWKGLSFLPTPARPGGAKSVLQYCRISHAANVELGRFGGEISHCVFEDGYTGLTLRNGGTGKVHHNRFLRCLRGMALDQAAGEVFRNEWQECVVGLFVSGVDPQARLTLEHNAFLKSRVAAVNYLKLPRGTTPALALANNHWSGTPDERLIGGGNAAAEVRLDPRLETPPADAGPGW